MHTSTTADTGVAVFNVVWAQEVRRRIIPTATVDRGFMGKSIKTPLPKGGGWV
jgi:hypothetical protein